MIRIKRLFLMAALLPCIAHAQTTLQKAVIVNAKGDSIHGMLEFKDWEFSPKTIRFQPNNAGETVKYTAAEVKFFSVEVGHLEAFEGYMGPISMNNINEQKISNGRDTSFKIDTVFLRVQQDGKKLKLFSYTDGIKTRFFLAESFADQPKELVYRMYWNTEVAGAGRTVYETDFKRQLYDEAVKAGVMTPALKSTISKAEYRIEDIIGIVSAINGVSATDSAKNNPGKHGATRTALIVVAGAIILGVLIHDFVVNHSSH